MDNLNTTYENIILIGNSNVELSVASMSDFLNICNLKYFAKQKNCYKNPEKPCISNSDKLPEKFSKPLRISGFSDFHKITLTDVKLHFPETKPENHMLPRL